ncbi:hypothetical protein H6F44_07105 [Pseudanabaena sp. FACHB-1277]|jgi:pyocin large subunit-like protein|uniref:Uncharacterized protein n=1 Tax=Pseudanabaena cinerea FACHB-1277 TaxID=2949581 RepID=A0A926URG0_9CYAN|nr:hypothetical protein [Pseudanabaena cinerea]MBD2149889.1 hypothetical protein [Pseudanabaena cinerea FACHB-1277]
MALFGLFGKKDNNKDSENSESSYFLDQDAAKTFGDINYMRTPKAVKKTFPTVNGVKGAEIIESVSATEKAEVDEVAENSNKTSEAIAQPSFEPKKINTRVDSSMDIFLNMAKDVKKR